MLVIWQYAPILDILQVMILSKSYDSLKIYVWRNNRVYETWHVQHMYVTVHNPYETMAYDI